MYLCYFLLLVFYLNTSIFSDALKVSIIQTYNHNKRSLTLSYTKIFAFTCDIHICYTQIIY